MNATLVRMFAAFVVIGGVTICATGKDSGMIDNVIQKEIDGGMAPGAVALIGDVSGSVYVKALGLAQVKPRQVPMQENSIFDVASITKVVATATSCAILYDRGKFDPYGMLPEYLPDHKGKGIDKISLHMLASHTSGFAAEPRYGIHGKGEKLFSAMLNESPKREVNTRFEYTCKGAIMLSTIVERLSGKSFGDFCVEEIFEPLEMNDSVFNRVEKSDRVVASHEPILGLSHNLETVNAGCAIGNAGLFTTALDLSNFCQMMLKGGVWKDRRILSEKAIAEFTKPIPCGKLSDLAFIWQTGTGHSHRPSLLSDKAYGHSGYTGQSIWIDPLKKVYVIVLTNRTAVIKDHRNPKVKRKQYEARARIGDAMLEWYQSK